MTEPTTLRMPVSQTAREIIEKLHPAIKDDWRLKLLKVEDEAIDAWRNDHDSVNDVPGPADTVNPNTPDPDWQ